METAEEVVETHKKQYISSKKLLPKLLISLKKINNTSEYEDYIKDYIKIPILDWIFDYLIIRPFQIFLVLFLFYGGLSAMNILFLKTTPTLVFIAESISIAWYLLVELKKDLWRKN